MRVLAKIIANDALFVTSNHVIDGVLQNQPKGKGESKSIGSIGCLQETAGEFSIEKSSAVRGGESCEGRKPTANHRQKLQ